MLHKFADNVHLGEVDVDLEVPAKLVQQVDALDKRRRQGQRARVVVELHDPADALHGRVVGLHLLQHRLHPRAPFQRRHRHDALDARIAFGAVFDEADLVDVLPASGGKISEAFQEDHRVDLKVAAVALIILDLVRLAEQRVTFERRVLQAVHVPDVQMRVDDREIGHGL